MELSRKFRIESRRVLWIVAVVLASVLVVQYFDIPYGDRVLSLFPMGKSYFNSSDANVGINQSSLLNNSLPLRQKAENGSVSQENLLSGNLPDIKHTDEEDDTIVRTASLVPEKLSNSTSAADEISPSSVEIEIAAAPNEAGDVADDNIAADLRVAPAPIEAGYEMYNVPTSNSTTSLVSGKDAGIAASPTTSGFPSTITPAPSESVSPEKTDVDVEAPVAVSSPPTAANEGGTSRNEHLSSPVAPLNVAINSPPPTEQPKSHENPSVPSVASISDMNDMLLRSRAASFSETPLWSSGADQELLDSRLQIEHAPIITNHPGLYSRIYRNLTTFVKSYDIMEEKLKVYVYKDGNKPVFHNPRLRGIYSSEGWFMKHLEASSQFVTSNPGEAHLFYLPFSSQLLVDYVYVKDSHSFNEINQFLRNYVDMIKVRHPFWNRTDGADHFLVGCHDWAPFETRHLMSKCIRALCNSDIKEGFKFGKDVALPETHIRSPQNPMRVTGGRPSSKRSTLAFFAGKTHGNTRAILLKHWENKDPDMKISGPIRKGYVWYMQNSKYCICAKGYEVNSPRVVEAILYGCVPVIVSDNFVPPFFDILNWETFAVFVLEKDIPNLKDVLVSISETRYAVMQHRVRQVRQHFLWHNTPQRYDIFHMILHSIWYNRVFRISSN